jgi:hypothetical protein
VVGPWWEVGGAGAGGAFLWIVIVHGIDLSQSAIKNEISWRPTRQGVLGVMGFFCCYLLLGFFAPFILTVTTMKEAVIAGLGWQGVFGHFIKPRSESPPSI